VQPDKSTRDSAAIDKTNQTVIARSSQASDFSLCRFKFRTEFVSTFNLCFQLNHRCFNLLCSGGIDFLTNSISPAPIAVKPKATSRGGKSNSTHKIESKRRNTWDHFAVPTNHMTIMPPSAMAPDAMRLTASIISDPMAWL
jgi:hypothetical protein